MVGTVVTYVGVLLCKNLQWMIVLMNVSGIWSGIRMSLGFVYMMEFIPENKKTIVGTAQLILEVAIAFMASIYFEFISKYWLPY